MSNLKLEAELRTDIGKGPARRLRQEGRLPGVVYGADQETLSISVDARHLANILQHAGSHSLIELQVNGGETQRVLVSDLVQDPVRADYVHVDFHAVALDVEMQTVVAVEVTGEERRTDDGVVAVILRELDISCLPTAIPESIAVDVSELAIGDVVTVADVVAPEGVTIISEPDEAVITVTPPQAELAEAADEETAEDEAEAAEDEE